MTGEKRHRCRQCLTRDRGLFSSPCFLTERAAARPTLSAGIVVKLELLSKIKVIFELLCVIYNTPLIPLLIKNRQTMRGWNCKSGELGFEVQRCKLEFTG